MNQHWQASMKQSFQDRRLAYLDSSLKHRTAHTTAEVDATIGYTLGTSNQLDAFHLNLASTEPVWVYEDKQVFDHNREVVDPSLGTTQNYHLPYFVSKPVYRSVPVARIDGTQPGPLQGVFDMADVERFTFHRQHLTIRLLPGRSVAEVDLDMRTGKLTTRQAIAWPAFLLPSWTGQARIDRG